MDVFSLHDLFILGAITDKISEMVQVKRLLSVLVMAMSAFRQRLKVVISSVSVLYRRVCLSNANRSGRPSWTGEAVQRFWSRTAVPRHRCSGGTAICWFVNHISKIVTYSCPKIWSVSISCHLIIIFLTGGGHWLVRMEWRPAGWSVCLPLLIYPCTMMSRNSLLAPADPGGPGQRAIKRLWCGGG